MLRGKVIIHFLLFLFALTYAYKKAYLPDFREYTVFLRLEITGQWEVQEDKAVATAKVEESEIEELEGRNGVLVLRKPFYIPESRRIEIFGNVSVKNNSIFIKTFSWEVEELPPKNKVRELFIKRFEEAVKDEELRALGLAFIFGESKRNLPLELERVFLHTGLIHVLVVSGLHVGLIFLILSRLLPKLKGEFLGLLGVLLYSYFLVPHNPPVLRATFMLAFYVFSLISFRKHCSLCSLFLVSTFLLLFFPHFVFSYSFWLSFFAVLYILLILRELEATNTIKGFLVSFSAFTGTAPLIGSFSFITPLSVILTPILSPLILSYALFSVLSLITLFGFPPSVIFMELSGKITLIVVKSFSEFSPLILTNLSREEAFLLSTAGAAGLFLTRGSYRLIPLILLNLYLLVKSL
ncbi:ComEC/Rec2 family competence protein [Aquifex pyrophilus]